MFIKYLLSGSILAVSLGLGLTGCGPDFDPQTRQGVWHPPHTNRADLTMMAANPADLVRGTGRTGSDGQLAAAAVDRLRINKVKKLPDAGLTDIQVQGQGGEAAGGN